MQRVLHLAVVLALATLAGYLLTDALPGDAALARLGADATAEQVAALRGQLGLDRPAPIRYLDWLGGALTGDLGVSWASGESVAPLLRDRFMVSLELMLVAQTFAVGLAVPLALLIASRPPRAARYAIQGGALACLSTPAYVFAILLTLVFSVYAGWLPASGFVPIDTSLAGNLRSLLLPALALALTEAPVYLRALGRELDDTLGQPWIRTARAYGASRPRVLIAHALRPAALPFVTLVALNVGHLIAGAVVVETIFAVPGMGRMLIDAVYGRDLPTVQACILVVAVSFVSINLVADAVCARLDPRQRIP
jgi:peptide/nickel transport system permease protein